VGTGLKTKQEIESCVAELGEKQAWNHNFVLPHGIETRPGVQSSHGKNLVKWDRIKPVLEDIGISAKRVLDIGCNEGFFSFKLHDDGAEVLGVDVDQHRLEKAMFISDILEKSEVEFRNLSIYDQEFSELPNFDFCLCLGFLHRIPDPFSALQRLADKSDIILLEWKALKFGPHDESFAYFTPGGYDEKDYYGTQFWVLSYACVEAILSRLGFDRFHRIDDPGSRRAILVAGRVDNPVFSRPDLILSRNRLRSILSHTKRYFSMLVKIITGRVNA